MAPETRKTFKQTRYETRRGCPSQAKGAGLKTLWRRPAWVQRRENRRTHPTPRTTSLSSRCLFFWLLVATLRLVGRVLLGGCSTSIAPLPAFHGVLVRCMLTSLIVVQLLAVRRVWGFLLATALTSFAAPVAALSPFLGLGVPSAVGWRKVACRCPSPVWACRLALTCGPTCDEVSAGRSVAVFVGVWSAYCLPF